MTSRPTGTDEAEKATDTTAHETLKTSIIKTFTDITIFKYLKNPLPQAATKA